MRTVCRLRLATCFLFLILAAAATQAQTLDARVSVVSLSPARVRVEGKRTAATSAWSFRNAYASAVGFAERIEHLSLADDAGESVPVRKLAPGEFEAARAATRFSYDLRLEPPPADGDAAHVSWLTGERGLLMLGDLLPLPLKDARVNLALPTGWDVFSTEAAGTSGDFSLADAEQTVFLVGRGLRARGGRTDSIQFNLAIAGAWAFDDAEAASAVSDILKEHRKTLGGAPQGRALVVVAPFPRPVAAHVWSAETRGNTVILLSGKAPSKVAALAQLGSALTHELFHLWVPNGLSLDGDYDWFYEGFTLYQALRAGMRLGQLSFQDYLNALGRAYDGYKAARGAKELSLVEASRRRWTVGPALVYNKGMLAAFLYDLTLMRETRGKSSLDDAYRELFRRYGGAPERADANRAVAEILGGVGGMRSFVERHIEGPDGIDLDAALRPFGMRVEPGGVRTHVGVLASLDGAQRDLLRKLGYNEAPDAATRKQREQLKKRLP